MPEKKTIERAKKAQRRGKSSSTQSGEFVREEMHHIREGNTVPDRPSRRSPLGSQRHVVPASIYRYQRRTESRKRPGAVPRVPMLKVSAVTMRRLHVDREPQNERSSARDAARRQEKDSPSKRAPQHDTAQEPCDRLQPGKLREQKADEDVP